jgi:hypothetical protein
MLKKSVVVLCAAAALCAAGGCATTATHQLQVSPKQGGRAEAIQALKCGAQQAGWSISYADTDSVSARKTVGFDNVPLTLNLVLQPGSTSPPRVAMTINNPRGIIGTIYQSEVVSGIQRCGANVLWTP